MKITFVFALMKEKKLRKEAVVSPSGRGIKGEALPNHHYYNPKLKNRAKNLRYEMTKAEACLWKYALRAGQMKGYNFNRQRAVLNYIADFMCKKLNLIIEVDGISHTLKERMQKI